MPHHQTSTTNSPFHREGEGVWGWGLYTGLNWYDYGFRFYDPQLARFHTVDPLAEYFPHQSPFVYANNNPIRYIDYLGLSASDTTYIAPDIRELTIIGTKPNNNSNSSSINFVRIWWNRLTNWWNSANPYTQTEVHDPNSQDMDWWHDSKVKGNHNVISRDNPLYERVFGWRNKRKKPKIEGDTEGKIEATIDDRYKEHLDNSNEPANEPVHNDFQWVGEESDSIIKTYLYKIDGQDTFLRDHKTSKHTGWGRPISKPYKKSK